MKIVINNCFGGFSLSDEAMELINYLKGRKLSFDELHDNSIEWRSDKDLVSSVEKLGEKASSRASKLEVIEYTPPKYMVRDYHDGYERIEQDDGY